MQYADLKQIPRENSWEKENFKYERSWNTRLETGRGRRGLLKNAQVQDQKKGES